MKQDQHDDNHSGTPEFIIRDVALPDDIQGIMQIDNSFVSNRILKLTIKQHRIELTEQQHQIEKEYPLSLSDLHITDENRLCLVGCRTTEDNGKIIGFMSAEFTPWNRRTIVHHLYVSRHHRGRGLGKALLHRADLWAKRKNARHVWVETQNLNLPAIEFYTRLGFKFCGTDVSLYDIANTETLEFPLFFCRDVT